MATDQKCKFVDVGQVRMLLRVTVVAFCLINTIKLNYSEMFVHKYINYGNVASLVVKASSSFQGLPIHTIGTS